RSNPPWEDRSQRPMISDPALVAQGIEHRPPEPGAQVRILPRAREPERGAGVDSGRGGRVWRLGATGSLVLPVVAVVLPAMAAPSSWGCRSGSPVGRGVRPPPAAAAAVRGPAGSPRTHLNGPGVNARCLWLPPASVPYAAGSSTRTTRPGTSWSHPAFRRGRL